MKKDGLTQKQLHERFQNITEQARDAGLTINYVNTLPVTTMKALRLTKWANDTQSNQKTLDWMTHLPKRFLRVKNIRT